MRKYGVATAMRPHTTLRRLLVHPKDKVELAEQGELVYQIPCKNSCEYTGETGRLDEHRTRRQCNMNNEKYTRSEKKIMSTFNKSAITDHVMTENYIIDWDCAKIIDKEPNNRK